MSSAIPLAGGDRIKVVVFFLVLAGTIIFGVIPILIALAGIYIMKKDKLFSPIINSKKYINGYLILLALGATITSSAVYYDENYISYNNQAYEKSEKSYTFTTTDAFFDFRNSFYEYNDKIVTETSMVAVGVIISAVIVILLLMRLFDFLYFRPLEEHKEWIVNNGIFSNLKENEDDSSTGIMGRDKLSSFSVADELIKWNDLLEKKLISQEEFDKAKQKLLNQK